MLYKSLRIGAKSLNNIGTVWLQNIKANSFFISCTLTGKVQYKSISYPKHDNGLSSEMKDNLKSKKSKRVNHT